MVTTLVKLVAAFASVGALACPGVAVAEPIPGIPDIPEVDETSAYAYGIEHQREICSILEYRFAQTNPVLHPVDSIITEISSRGAFNYETAGFAVGVAMGSSCPQFIDPFEDVLGEDLV